MPPVYERKDHYYQKAKEAGLASRAVYKLEEMDRRFKLLKPDFKVLELGCAPGGWLQYLSKKVGKSGKVVGVDLLKIQSSLPPQAIFIQGDITQEKVQQDCMSHLGGKADLVLSDLSPNLSGVKFRDCYASYQLAVLVFSITQKILKRTGDMVFKIFPGEEWKELKKEIQQHFTEIKTFIPDATRKGSSEIYVIARSLNGKPS